MGIRYPPLRRAGGLWEELVWYRFYGRITFRPQTPLWSWPRAGQGQGNGNLSRPISPEHRAAGPGGCRGWSWGPEFQPPLWRPLSLPLCELGHILPVSGWRSVKWGPSTSRLSGQFHFQAPRPLPNLSHNKSITFPRRLQSYVYLQTCGLSLPDKIEYPVKLEFQINK